MNDQPASEDYEAIPAKPSTSMEQGYLAAKRGEPVYFNPYKRKDNASIAWMIGWLSFLGKAK
jgi:hypothetical protein